MVSVRGAVDGVWFNRNPAFKLILGLIAVLPYGVTDRILDQLMIPRHGVRDALSGTMNWMMCQPLHFGGGALYFHYTMLRPIARTIQMPGSGLPSPSQDLLRAAARVYADNTIGHFQGDSLASMTFSNIFPVFDSVLDALDEDRDPLLSHRIAAPHSPLYSTTKLSSRVLWIFLQDLLQCPFDKQDAPACGDLKGV